MTREETLPNMSHKEMIDTLKGLVFGTFDRTTAKEREAVDMAIKALEQRWIPVSERLPKKYDTVIGVNRFGDIYKTELYDDCGEKKWYADGDFDVPIVAWIPFPNYMKIESEEGSMNNAIKELLEKEIEKAKDMLKRNIGEDEKYAIRYHMLCCEEMLEEESEDKIC